MYHCEQIIDFRSEADILMRLSIIAAPLRLITRSSETHNRLCAEFTDCAKADDHRAAFVARERQERGELPDGVITGVKRVR
jgi:hypothetical protein